MRHKLNCTCFHRQLFYSIWVWNDLFCFFQWLIWGPNSKQLLIRTVMITIYACKTRLKEEHIVKRENLFFFSFFFFCFAFVHAPKSSSMPLSHHGCSLMSVLFDFLSNRQRKANFDNYIYHAFGGMQMYIWNWNLAWRPGFVRALQKSSCSVDKLEISLENGFRLNSWKNI